MQAALMRAIVGAIVALLLAAIVVLERLDAARDTVASIRNAAGDSAADAAGPDLTVAWLVAIVIAVVAACCLTWILAEATGEHRRTWMFGGTTIALLVAWAIWGAFSDAPSAFRSGIHFATIGLLAIVILVVAPVIVGAVAVGWERASAVRVEMLLLALLYLVVFVVPLTGDQMAEVLRAWGDADPLSRVFAGLAGAVMLGVTIRASARRLLELAAPDTAPAGDISVRRGIFIGVAGLLGVVELFRGAEAAGAALLLAAVAAAASKPNGWTVPTVVVDGQRRPAIDQPARRLADTLGLMPVLIVTAGLAVATVDSWLASAPSAWTLTAITVLALALFAALVGHAYESDADPRRRLGNSNLRLVVAGIGAVALGLLAGAVGEVPALLLLIVSVLLALRVPGYDSPLVFSTAAGAALGVLVSIYTSPVTGPRALGVLGCVFFVLSGVVVLLHLAATWSERQDMRSPPWASPWFTHVPLVTLLVIWVAVAFMKAPTTAHQVRTVDRGGEPAITIDHAVATWLQLVPGERGGRPTPMLLVGASGGGTKAAYWTGLVLDCLTGGVPPEASGDNEQSSECGPPRGRERIQQLFLTSSVSGGSIGILDYIGHLTHDRSIYEPWVDAKVGREVLSPLTAWGLVHDAPALLIGHDTDPNACVRDKGPCWSNADRALVQEVAIAGFEDEDNLRGVPGSGILSEATGGPFPVFNASLNGGVGRLVTSRLDLAPLYRNTEGCPAEPERSQPLTGVLDAHDVLADAADVPHVTAAHLSARFPVLEPPARVGEENGKGSMGCDASSPLTAVRVRDGGYVENTGLLTIADLLPAIRAALDRRRPRTPIIVLSVDDDPAVPTPKPVLDEEDPVNPVSVGTKVSDDYLTRKARDTITSCQTPGVAYMRISPEPHVGAHAATGWEISKTSRRHDLGRSLAQGTAGSRQITVLRRWLDGVEAPGVC